MVDDRDLYRLVLREDAGPPPTYTGPTALTAETIRAAVAKIRDTQYEPPVPPAMSPAAHDAVNDLLGRPHGTAITMLDLARAQQALYDRCTPEEKDRLVEMVLRAAGW